MGVVSGSILFKERVSWKKFNAFLYVEAVRGLRANFTEFRYESIAERIVISVIFTSYGDINYAYDNNTYRNHEVIIHHFPLIFKSLIRFSVQVFIRMNK
jgi:hypothetical protein